MRHPTARRPRGGPAWSVVPLVAVAVLLAACSGNPSALTATTVAPAKSTTTTSPHTTTTTLPTQRFYALYFLRGNELGVSSRLGSVTTDPHYTAIRDLVAGTIPAEASAGLSTDIPAGTVVRGLQIKSTVAILNLSPQFVTTGTTASEAGRLAQVVYTLTSSPGVTAVELEVGGTRIVNFAGVNLTNPVGRAQVTAALPLVLLEEPAVGSSLVGSLTISGLTSTSTSYVVQLIDPTGRLLASVTNAAAAGGTFEQSVPFTISGPETATVKLFAQPSSSKATAQSFQFTLPISP
jgi:spore germination protein GerM